MIDLVFDVIFNNKIPEYLAGLAKTRNKPVKELQYSPKKMTEIKYGIEGIRGK